MRKSLVLLTGLVVVLCGMRCSHPTMAGGDTSQTGNSLVAGIVCHGTAQDSSAIIVALLAGNYFPGFSSDPVRYDTAGANGEFSFDSVGPGSYTIEAHSPSSGMRALADSIVVAGAPVAVPPETLSVPGALRVPLCNVDASAEVVCIPATSRYTRLSSEDRARGYAVIDSVPVAQVSHIGVLLAGGSTMILRLTSLAEIAQGDTSDAHPYPVYHAVRALAPVTIDGVSGEFAAAPPIVLFDSVGARAEYRLMYDDSALYISANVADAWLTFDSSGLNESYDDCMELMFDTHHDRGQTPHSDDFKLFVNVQNIHEDVRGADTTLDDSWNCVGCSSFVRISGTINDNSDIDSGYTIELAVPWRSIEMQCPVAPTDTLGLEIVFDNNKSIPSDRIWTAWANTNADQSVIDSTLGSYWQSLPLYPINDPAGWGNVVFK